MALERWPCANAGTRHARYAKTQRSASPKVVCDSVYDGPDGCSCGETKRIHPALATCMGATTDLKVELHAATHLVHPPLAPSWPYSFCAILVLLARWAWVPSSELIDHFLSYSSTSCYSSLVHSYQDVLCPAIFAFRFWFLQFVSTRYFPGPVHRTSSSLSLHL